MMNRSLRQRAGKWLAVAVLLGAGFAAMAQTEPTLNQIYDAAQAGRMDQAQVMMQQVLVAHPKSAKAHFVQAELAARQGQMPRAREALAEAEKLAPGLPFAKPEAVQSLRARLAAKPVASAAPTGGSATTRPSAMAPQVAPAAAAAAPAPSSSFPTGLGLALGGGAIAAAIFMLRRKPAPLPAARTDYANPAMQGSGLSGPHTFGTGGSSPSAPVYGQPSYAQPGNGQPGYGQAPGSGIGGKVMGGLATGLAVGAGVMAAQAIGKSLMGGHEERPAQPAASTTGNDYQPFARNDDMGGQNFGVNDAGSWDDGSSMASGDGGGDWDT